MGKTCFCLPLRRFSIVFLCKAIDRSDHCASANKVQLLKKGVSRLCLFYSTQLLIFCGFLHKHLLDRLVLAFLLHLASDTILLKRSVKSFYASRHFFFKFHYSVSLFRQKRQNTGLFEWSDSFSLRKLR